MYEVGVVAQFEAAHRLVGNFGPATRLHGHTYRLEATVRGDRLQADGTLFDITRLNAALAAIVADLHFCDLGETPGLAGINTTVENVAGYCWERLAAALRDQPLSSLRVQLWENPQGYAARDEALPAASTSSAISSAPSNLADSEG